jgi:hypothetical protein
MLTMLLALLVAACDDSTATGETTTDTGERDAAPASDAAVPRPDRGGGDGDGDGVPDGDDNCPDVSNPNQEDRDGDHLGDVCDARPDQLDYQLKSARLLYFGGPAAGAARNVKAAGSAARGTVEDENRRVRGGSNP